MLHAPLPVFDRSPQLQSAASRAARLALHLSAALLLAATAACQTVQSGGLVDPDAGSPQNIASLTDVVQSNPSDAAALNVRGTAFARAGRFDQAIGDFSRAIQINPNLREAYANRALVLRRQNNFPAALADYNRAVEIDPRYQQAYIGRGDVYRLNNQLELAINDYNRALEISGNPQAFHSRGLDLPGAGPAPACD